VSFDRLVGAADERQRNREAERLCGLEIDDQLHFGGLLDRQIGGLLALENAAGVDGSQTIHVGGARSVAHQAAVEREFPLMEDSWYGEPGRKRDDLGAPAVVERVGGDPPP